MGCPWEIDIWDAEIPENVDKKVIDLLDSFNATYSRFRNDSLVARFACESGRIVVPRDCVTMLRIYQGLYEASDGRMNPLIGQTLSDAGYDAQYSLTPKVKLAQTPPFEEVITIIDDETIELTQPVLIDFGALGKGYAVDLVVQFLASLCLTSYVVNGSGDMRHVGQYPLTVGLEHPDDERQIVGTIELTNRSLASSGSNRRVWGMYHHILDPHNQMSPDFITSTWVHAHDAATADIIATALFLVTPEVLQEKYSFEYVLLNKDGYAKISTGWPGDVYV